jgi:RNA polymerase sigma-70 factor (ECF subfamily)
MNPQTAQENLSLWVNQYGDYLFSWAFSRIKNRQTCEDLVQETFLTALKSYPAFEHKSQPKTWLIAILKRKMVDYFRQNTRKAETPYPNNDIFFDEKGHWHSSESLYIWPAEAELLDQADFLRALQACLNRLSEKARSVMLAKYIENKKHDEICQELELSASNYWQLLHRSKLLLRKCLETKYFNF